VTGALVQAGPSAIGWNWARSVLGAHQPVQLQGAGRTSRPGPRRSLVLVGELTGSLRAGRLLN